jgi:hypothetical protein
MRDAYSLLVQYSCSHYRVLCLVSAVCGDLGHCVGTLLSARWEPSYFGSERKRVSSRAQAGLHFSGKLVYRNLHAPRPCGKVGELLWGSRTIGQVRPSIHFSGYRVVNPHWPDSKSRNPQTTSIQIIGLQRRARRLDRGNQRENILRVP